MAGFLAWLRIQIPGKLCPVGQESTGIGGSGLNNEMLSKDSPGHLCTPHLAQPLKVLGLDFLEEESLQ